MKLYDRKKYTNLLNDINLNYDDIVYQIKDYKLSFSQVRNYTVEHNMKIPIFVEPFYDYVLNFNRIPNQEEFYNYYLGYSSNYFISKRKELGNLKYKEEFNKEIIYGLKARAFRTYPSIVRDICFNILFRECNPKLDVKYNISLDVEEGIDLMVSFEEKNWGICLYTKTKNSESARIKKYDRHTLFENVKIIEFPIDLNNGVNCGDFLLYGKDEERKILEILRNDYRDNK